MISFETFHQSIDQTQENIILKACFRQYWETTFAWVLRMQIFNFFQLHAYILGWSCELLLWKALRYLGKSRMRK